MPSYADESPPEITFFDNPVVGAIQYLELRTRQQVEPERRPEVYGRALSRLPLDEVVGSIVKIDTRIALIRSPDLQVKGAVLVARRGLDFIGEVAFPEYTHFRESDDIDIDPDAEQDTSELIGIKVPFLHPLLVQPLEEQGIEVPGITNEKTFRISAISVPVLAITSWARVA